MQVVGLRREPGMLHPRITLSTTPVLPAPGWESPWKTSAQICWHGLEGLHFHTLCEQNADALGRTRCAAVEEKFGPYLSQMKWLNLGRRPPHHPARITTLTRWSRCVSRLQEQYRARGLFGARGGRGSERRLSGVHGAGYRCKTAIDIAILDTSAACHMPDVLEMPYRPATRRRTARLGEKAYDLPPGRPYLSGGRRDRGLQL